ncbi:MAG: enoyl-CoA hydratase/isomerase family protein [Myxococcales bacterium]
MSSITLETQGKVGVLTMNYKKENRFNPEFLIEFMEVLDKVDSDAAIGALVVTGGDPKFFCNGIDLDWLVTQFPNIAQVVPEYMGSLNRLYRRICIFPKPTIAAINGHVFAGGVFLACHMDFRFMREDRGWMRLPEVDINIPLLPAMTAITQAVVTPQGFRDMYYTGRKFTGPEALQIGFADRLYGADALLPKSVEFAEEMAKKKTSLYAEMKRRLRAPIVEMLDKVDPDYFSGAMAFI